MYFTHVRIHYLHSYPTNLFLETAELLIKTAQNLLLWTAMQDCWTKCGMRHLYIHMLVSSQKGRHNYPSQQTWTLCDPQTERLLSQVLCNWVSHSKNMKQLTTMQQVFKVFPHIPNLDSCLTLVDIIKHILFWDNVWCGENFPHVRVLGFNA